MQENREYIPRLRSRYYDEIAFALQKEFDLSNVMMVPKLTKVVLNMGVGSAVHDTKKVKQAVDILRMVSGQHPVITKAKKSIAGFKLREGMSIGCKVTIRKDRMFEFIDRLVTIALPRVRDFRGLSPKSFDSAGNYSFGIREHIVFPEVDYGDIEEIYGMDVCIGVKAQTTEHAKALLQALGFPFYSR